MSRWLLAFGVCLAFLACLACGKHELPEASAQAATKKKASPSDPDAALYEQVRSGAYEISTALDSIEEARKPIKAMTGREAGQTKEALLDIASHLDDAGEILSDFGDDPPPINEFKANFGVQDEHRLKAIDAGNAALGHLHDAQDLVGTLIESKPPEPEKTELDAADSALDDCIEATEDAIKAMGGKVTVSETD